MKKYLIAVTANELQDTDVDKIVENLFAEFSVESSIRGISYTEFQQVVSLMDFQSKLLIPL